jgi:mRNA interferase RelE/StbE
MYQVIIERYAQKQLARIPQPNFDKIAVALRALATTPRPAGCKKLKGRAGYRIRVGNYRVIYNIKDNILTVFVLLIGDRKDVYD